MNTHTVYRKTKTGLKSNISVKQLFAKTLLKRCSARMAAKRLQANRKTAKKATTRQKRVDQLPAKVRIKVTDFYRSAIICNERPEQRFRGLKLMTLTLIDAYRLFCKENITTKLGYTSFKKLRPKDVLVRPKFQINCACTYCTNVNLVLSAINRRVRQSTSTNKPDSIRNVYKLINLVLCDKDVDNRFHNYKCIQGLCSICQDTSSTIHHYYKDCDLNLLVKWQKWEQSKVTINFRKDGVFQKGERSRRILVHHHGPLKGAIESLIECFDKPCQGTTMPQHMFTAAWQDKQFQECKETCVKPNTAVAIYDFSQNFQSIQQDEIKSAHFAKQQITLHPIPTYYVDPLTDDIVRESFMISSNDLTHDNQAVDAFRRSLIHHLREVRNINLTCLIEWSDGAAHEYKSVAAFKRASLTASELNLKINSNFFGSEHGKADSDGETGAWKSQMTKHILGDPEAKTIYCAEDARDFGESKMKSVKVSHFKGLGPVKTFRTFHVINEIDRSCDLRNFYSIQGTRIHIHRVESSGDPSVIITQNLSCFCDHCNVGSPCRNKEYVMDKAEVRFKAKGSTTSKTKCILFNHIF